MSKMMWCLLGLSYDTSQEPAKYRNQYVHQTDPGCNCEQWAHEYEYKFDFFINHKKQFKKSYRKERYGHPGTHLYTQSCP